MLSQKYLNIRYLWPLLVVLLFVCSPTYVCFNIAEYQTCWPLGGFSHIFLQDIHVIAFHEPNEWKIIIDQFTAKNWKGFLQGQVLIIQSTLGHFFFCMWNLVAQDVVASLIYFFFIHTFFLINPKVLCVNEMDRNAQE